MRRQALVRRGSLGLRGERLPAALGRGARGLREAGKEPDSVPGDQRRTPRAELLAGEALIGHVQDIRLDLIPRGAARAAADHARLDKVEVRNEFAQDLQVISVLEGNAFQDGAREMAAAVAP